MAHVQQGGWNAVWPQRKWVKCYEIVVTLMEKSGNAIRN